jgi:ankyrin repeat protein
MAKLIDEVIKHCQDNNGEALKTLKFSLLDKDDKSYYPLHTAVFNNSVEAVKYLVTFDEIKEAINLKSPDRYQLNPLNLAAKFCDNNAIIIDILIENGADINSRNGWSNTPLIEAAFLDNCNCVRALLKHHPDISIKNRFGTTALQRAKPNSERIIRDWIIHNQNTK